MKKLFTILSIAFTLSSSAQISIVRSDYGAIGNKVKYAVDTPASSSLNAIINLTGVNKTWNFSTASLVPNKYDSAFFVSPSVIPNPPANANLILVTANNNQFLNVDSNFVRAILDQPSYNINNISLKIFKFPFTFGTTHIDSLIFTKKGIASDFNQSPIAGVDSLRFDIRAYTVAVGQGYGTLVLPDTSCTALQVKSTVVTYVVVSAYAAFFGGWGVVQDQYQKNVNVQWLSKNSKSFMAQAAMDTNGTSVQGFTYWTRKILIPKLTFVTPNNAQRGQTLNVTISGTNTHFTQGSNISVLFSQGSSSLLVNNVIAINDSTLIANITVKQTNTIGLHAVTVVDPIFGELTLASAFQVNASTNLPSLLRATPSRIFGLLPLNVTITGKNTHFTQGTNAVNFNYLSSPTSTLIVNSVNATNDTTLICDVKILGAVNGNYDILVNNTVDGPLTLSNAVNIATGINETQNSLSSLSIYPNPANDKINISFAQQSSEVSIHVFDMTGRLLKTTFTSKNNIEMDMTDLSNGIYFVTVSGKDFTTSQKIMINK